MLSRKRHGEMHEDLPREDHEEGKRGKLGKAMYGTRDAAQIWEIEYTEMMTRAELKQGMCSACLCSTTSSKISGQWLTEMISQLWGEVKTKIGSGR